MKKILLLNTETKIVGDLQAKFARQCEILATDSTQTALQLIKTVPVELFLAQLPSDSQSDKYNELRILLKKLKRRKYKIMTKILLVSEGGECHVDEFLKQGISAVVMDVGEVGRWIN